MAGRMDFERRTAPAFIKSGKYTRWEKAAAWKLFWSELMPVVALVVATSFEGEGGMTVFTRAEVKQRTLYCKGIVEELRRDHGWSKQRISDNLQHVLSARLAGLHLDLESFGRRATW